ncbi:MAG: carbohydrate porin [Chthoniobacterales bacterium]|nr:carbohydrate porin [Chthoniobacterales bacterium]
MIPFVVAALFFLGSLNQAFGTTEESPTSNSTLPPPAKKIKGRGLAAMVSAVKSLADEDEHELIGDLFDPNSFSQKNINPNFTMPIMPHTVKELKYASKNYWFGPRDALAKHGIGFAVTYTGVVVSNPVGGHIPGGCDYYDIIALTSILSTQELFGWHGGHFIMSAVQQDGGYNRNLTTTNVGNQFVVNSGVKGYTFKWVNLYYQQLFLNDRWEINLGRFSAMDEFDVSPILWNYIGTLQASPTNFQTTWSPNASWASRLKVRVKDDIDLRFGVFQLTTDSLNGLNWNFYPNDAVSLLSQATWNPQFGRPGDTFLFQGSKKESSQTGSATASKKSFSAPVDPSKLQRLPGHYFAGGFYNTTGLHQYGDWWLPTQYNAYGFYCHADQLVYRPNPLTDAGLTLWSELCYSPQSDATMVSYQVKGGAIYTGLIPGRRNDFTIFGAGYGRFSSSYASYNSANNTTGANYGDPTYEVVLEWGYRINFTRFIFLQPDIQFIINPAGTGHIPDALILGTEAGIVF